MNQEEATSWMPAPASRKVGAVHMCHAAAEHARDLIRVMCACSTERPPPGGLLLWLHEVGAEYMLQAEAFRCAI